MAVAVLERNSAEASGELSLMPLHVAELASDSYEREFALSLMESKDQTLRQIEEALERMQAGTYGVCERCKAKIPKARLNAVAYTNACVKCASHTEWE
jgi:RNA polymerase-binding transcription factor DksA